MMTVTVSAVVISVPVVASAVPVLVPAMVPLTVSSMALITVRSAATVPSPNTAGTCDKQDSGQNQTNRSSHSPSFRLIINALFDAPIASKGKRFGVVMILKSTMYARTVVDRTGCSSVLKILTFHWKRRLRKDTLKSGGF
jgi:hypothetical protein